MNKRMASSIAIALLLVAGCAALGPKLASSAEDIVGTWQSTNTSAELQINEDGTTRVEFGDGSFFTDQFRFERTRLFFSGNGIYEVELLENGNLKFTVIEDENQTRANYLAGGLIEAEWEPVP